jgi:hypothetical protein
LSQEFYRGFQATLNRTGVTLDRQSVFQQGDERNIGRQLKDLYQKYKPDIFMCLLDPQQKNVYAEIKEVCGSQPSAVRANCRMCAVSVGHMQCGLL